MGKLNSINLSSDLNIIELNRFMVRNQWQNTSKLQIRWFSDGTGRGVASRRTIPKGTPLITVPFDLLITVQTLLEEGFFVHVKSILSIQECLTVFLMVQKQKQSEETKWYSYIKSLPEEITGLPWLTFDSEGLKGLPQDLCDIATDLNHVFQCSASKCKRVLKDNFNIEITDGFDELFTWAYGCVTTRSIYTPPELMYTLTSRSEHDFKHMICDKPNLGLCPLLDLFNHHHMVNTITHFIQDEADCNPQQIHFELIHNSEEIKPYEQIFISYGHSLDSVKLLMNYGLVLDRNPNDRLYFTLDDCLNCSQQEKQSRNLNRFQYQQIGHLQLLQSPNLLYITSEKTLSFNLKALLFIIFNENVRNFNMYIFNRYPVEYLEKLDNSIVRELLRRKNEEYEETLTDYRLKNYHRKTSNFNQIERLLHVRLQFVQNLINNTF